MFTKPVPLRNTACPETAGETVGYCEYCAAEKPGRCGARITWLCAVFAAVPLHFPLALAGVSPEMWRGLRADITIPKLEERKEERGEQKRRMERSREEMRRDETEEREEVQK